MKWTVLRVAMAMIVPAGLYAVYLSITGEKTQSIILFNIVAIPIFMSWLNYTLRR
jgi:hypothetical protein